MSPLNRTILILLVLTGLPFYWFFLDNSGPDANPQPVNVAQLRDLALAGGERGPDRIRFEHIATYSRMSNRVAAGTGLRWIDLYTLAYLLEYDDGAPVLVGSGITQADAQRLDQRNFNAKAQQRVGAALKRARTLVPLEPAEDQLGGFSELADTAQGKALAGQIDRQSREDAAGKPYRVAPGVVVVPTAELKPGSRLVFVHMSDGREFVFAGSLAQIRQSWSQMRLPARFVTDLGRREDRRLIRSWLLTLRTFKRESPKLVIVSGNRLPDKGRLIRYFDNSANILSKARNPKSRWSFGRDWYNAPRDAPPMRPSQDRHL